MNDPPTLLDLSVGQIGLTARSISVHRQMLIRHVSKAEGWKKDELLEQIEDLQKALEIVMQREQEMLSDNVPA